MREQSIGALLRELRQNAGRTQQEQADELNRLTGRYVDRHQVSDWERCVIPGPYWRGQLAESFGVPTSLLGRAAATTRRLRRVERLSLRDGDTEGPVDRRKFLGTAAITAGSVAEPWGRLAAALSGGAVDEALARQLTDATAALYLDEEHVPAALLSARLAGHVDMITAVIPRAGRHRKELIIAAGETAALAGWAAWDQGDRDAASHYYRAVRKAAREAGHPPLETLAMAYGSYGMNDPVRAARLLREAQEMVKGPGYATALAWTAAREAEEHARTGESGDAVRALDRARLAYEYAVPEREQSWVRFLRPARLDSMAVSTYTRLGHPEAARQADESLSRLGDGQPKISIAVLCDAAMAHVKVGDVERGVWAARRAFDTAVSHGYMGMAMVNARMRDLVRALPESSAARGLREDIRALAGHHT
ncbi:hypothetical protein GCM10010387_18930 [Streptomyces inusitatus]|uniref:Transcriptional regulator n=1 Tax=Streptomyces inusitatus TaxID=68221 RepID=A0A918UPX9_9ACTN|nr:transcriptional regulator [Streptomyces inusitatus]GGZ25593.1 hypothetical protein GCM10010387_18930 [Streptomyces inusitatus]